ncbi:hypothetical protein N7475_008340 [Penicillium sp. IBT 31633x]|nr:hypothetical protein N7475_008340 [Penicillium sp. IBT 31633x]
MSTFMAPPNINGTVSSNASTYCESDFGSLEHFDEPFTTRTAETQTTLVHPAPKSDMSMAANNLSLLSSTEDASYLPSKPADAPQDQQAFLNSHIQAPSIANYDMSTSLNLHPHNSHHVPPTISPSSKHPSYDHTTSWAVWKTNTITDTWDFMQDPNGTSDYGGWHNQDLYSARWSGATNAYAPSEEPNNPTSHTHVMNNESVIASFGPRPVALPSSFPITHQAHAPASAPHVASIEVPNECLLPSQPIYLPNKTVYHHTSFGSPNHRPVNSLSPSAFTPSTTEEDPSPQQSGEERSGIEASMHYSDERNAFLIDCKRRGLSYKDIKRVGGFKEAESTLRGRYRTLTKSKDQRVRKPKWQDKDIRLLCEAVSIHTETPNTYGALTNVSMGMNEPPKVSWKKVAEHIWSQGGTYHFGNATCKKKWCEIHNMTL